MSEKRIDSVAWSSTRGMLGRLLRELYDQPQQLSPELSRLIAKLKESDDGKADEKFDANRSK